MTGESASPDQSGYVLEPGGYVNIQGWRKDLSRTAAFYFSDPADSYAARTGRPHDLGVIGVALFRERPVEQPAWLSKDRRSAAPACAGAGRGRRCRSSQGQPSRGRHRGGSGHAATVAGHGARSRRVFAGQQVEFERASTQPDEMIAIRYERRETLVAMGVIPKPRYSFGAVTPIRSRARLGFVPDP